MLLIYTHKITPRLQYIADLLLRELLEIDFEFTTSTDRFYQHEGYKLNYSRNRIGGELFIYSHSILFESEIHQQRMEYGEVNGITTLFSSNKEDDLSYDPFAASFFLVSRYEEYLPFKEDKYGRYRIEKSAAYDRGFNQIPVVNHYALHLKELLQLRYPDLVFPSKAYQFVLTYDIDQAFKYSDIPWFRKYGSLVRSLFRRDKEFLKERKAVLSGQIKDPYDTYDYQFELNNRYRIYPIYFFHMGNYGANDKSNVWNSRRMGTLVKSISEKYLIGIHPSYNSHDKPKKIEMEIARLNAASSRQITRSRQHFLRMSFPETYRRLIEQGITEDYTLGNPGLIGFRASIASPFYFYDLIRDENTNLRIFPFAAMDSALYYHMKVTSETALSELKILVDEVKKVHGTFIYIAHNDLIGKQSPWKGWNSYYEQFIEYARE